MNGILLVDKPAGITSHDVVDHARRRLGIQRIGHAGTLDPAATGLLILLIGPATRQAADFQGLDKNYRATLRLGETTDTQDSEGRILRRQEVPSFTSAQLEEVFARFRGEIEQEVPAYSAVRIQGKHSYEFARAGVEVARPVRSVTIYDLKILSVHLPDIEFEASCSKGTYIRTLCADIGETLGCGGHLCQLRRTRIGSYRIEDAVTLEELQPGHLHSVHASPPEADPPLAETISARTEEAVRPEALEGERPATDRLSADRPCGD